MDRRSGSKRGGSRPKSGRKPKHSPEMELRVGQLVHEALEGKLQQYGQRHLRAAAEKSLSPVRTEFLTAYCAHMDGLAYPKMAHDELHEERDQWTESPTTDINVRLKEWKPIRDQIYARFAQLFYTTPKRVRACHKRYAEHLNSVEKNQ